MNQKTRATLMSFFETGDRPTEEQFRQLIDSLVNKADDEIYILFPSKNTGIGVPEPKERLDVKGGIRIGATSNEFPGIIRWNGSDFEGYDGQQWRSLTRDVQASREIFIPEPRIECTADVLYTYWEDCTDRRFLDFQPRYWLYRYKSRIKQTYKDRTKRTRILPKKWAHTSHQDKQSHANPRNTEFIVNAAPGVKQLINMEPYKWFKKIPGDSASSYLIPRGQGMYPVPQRPYFNRRFEYFRLRIVINTGGQLVFGPFSEIFSLGYRRKYYRDAKVKKYKPVFEMVHSSKGMNHA